MVELFRSPSTSFVTVCAPSDSSLDVAVFFQEELARRNLPRGGVVVNQVHACHGETHDAKATLGTLAEQVGADLPPSTVAAVLARLGMAHRRLHALRVAEQELTAALQLEPASTESLFLRAVVRVRTENLAEHHMHRESGRYGLVDQIEELAELDRTMLRAGLVHDLPGRQVQRSEQIGDTMTLVVMGHGSGTALLDRQ